MITTGSPKSPAYKTRTTEVVDVVTGETCADLADFPLQISSAVGGNLHGTPVVCGGGGPNGYSQICYKITNAGWQQFAIMKEKRYIAAGVVHKNTIHVFGAAGAGLLLQSSEIISIDGDVEYGPELPQAVLRHAITSINSSVSIMSGGQTSAGNLSPLTWYFNHETNVFSSGPSLLEGRYEHASATCVDKMTTAKIPMVNGGAGKGGKGLDTTELLINGKWQSGTIQF